VRLADLLAVVRDEFATAADDIDTALAAWMGDEPSHACTHCESLCSTFERLAEVSRLVGLEGQAHAIHLLRDGARQIALADDAAMAEGLAWLAMWRDPLAGSFDHPADATAAQTLLDHVAVGPTPLSGDAIDALRALLLMAPSLPDDAHASQTFDAPTHDDVSIAVPDDVDVDLYESFLAEAPGQLASLGDTVRALARGPVDVARVLEAQRVAHTFKGSGNIIGIRGIGRLAHRMEDVLELAVVEHGALPAPMAHDLEAAAATLDQMIYALRGEESAPTDALERLAALVGWARSIDDGSWPERAAAAPVPAASDAQTMRLAASAPQDLGTHDVEAQVRVPAPRMDRLVRQAGQSLVQTGRLAERAERLAERLTALNAAQASLAARLRELQTQIDRQGVSLRERSQQEGGFDSLEMDRYNELHALVRFVVEAAADSDDMTRGAREDLRAAAQDLSEHERALKAQHAELLRTRLVPFRQIVPRLRRNVSQTAAATGKPVQLVVEGEQIQLDSDVLERLTEPLLHLVRNAVDHGIESAEQRALLGKPAEGTVHLQVSRDGQAVHVRCRDDGGGLDLSAIHAKAISLGLVANEVEPDADTLSRLILLPGFSTRAAANDISGRGVGMDVVAERIRAMKGHLDIQSIPLEGSSFTLRVPATTGSAHALIVETGGERVALATESVVIGLAAGQGELRDDGRLHWGERSWPLASLAERLGLPDGGSQAATLRPAVVLRCGHEEIALSIDRVVEARELILQETGRLLRCMRSIGSGAVRPDGRVLFMLDSDAIGTPDSFSQGSAATRLLRQAVARPRALVVDDSLSMRKTLSQLLHDAGFDVFAARDGFDALEQLARTEIHIVLTDLEMPNLNGLDLTRRLRESPSWRALPVIMISSRGTDKHRARAEQAGVSDYFTKPYSEAELLARVRAHVAA